MPDFNSGQEVDFSFSARFKHLLLLIDFLLSSGDMIGINDNHREVLGLPKMDEPMLSAVKHHTQIVLVDDAFDFPRRVSSLTRYVGMVRKLKS